MAQMEMRTYPTYISVLFWLVVAIGQPFFSEKVFGQGAAVRTENVDFCRISSDPAKYLGKLMRTRITMVAGLDWAVVTHRNCYERGLRFDYDTSEDQDWKKVIDRMNAKTEFDSDISKVDLVVLCKLVRDTAS